MILANIKEATNIDEYQNSWKQQRNLEEQIDHEEKEEIITKKKKEKNLSTINKVAENNEINSKDFDELVENILTRNSTRSYPKINDIPK